MALGSICATGIYMSKTATQIRASARALAPKRRDALTEDRRVGAEVRDTVRRLRSEGILGPESADLFGVKTQQIYTWLNGYAKGPALPTSQADALRAEAKELAAMRLEVWSAAEKVNAEASSLAAEVDECEEIGPGEFCEILGVDRQQYYRWLGLEGG